MKQDIVLTFLGIILTVLILARVREKYTTADRLKVSNLFDSYTGTTRDSLKAYIVLVIMNEITEDPVSKLSNVNLLVDTLNTGRTNQWTHYSTVNDIDTMLETAYTSGESGLTARDRVILRAMAWPAIDISTSNPFAPLTYTSGENVPDFAATIITESGNSSREMLLFCYVCISLMQAGGTGVMTPEIIDYINSYLPDKFAPKYDTTYNGTLGTLLDQPFASMDDKTKWLWKALLLGPAYIANLAENKWRLDLDWTPPA